MKYQRAAILLATTASSLMMGSDGLDTVKHDNFGNNPRQLMPMYGYCIGCVALMTTHAVVNTDFTATTITSSSSSSMVKNVTLSRYSGGVGLLDHATSSSETKLFLPTPKNTEHTSFTNLHQMNLILISRSMHNSKGGEQPFLSDLLALSLFLVAVAIGIAWGSTKGKKEENDEEHEFDLISKRLLNNDFYGIGLVPTIEDDDEDNDNEDHIQEQQQENVEKEVLTNDISVLHPVVVDTAQRPQWTLPHEQEWKPLFHPIDDKEDETSTITEEGIISGYLKYLPPKPVVRKNKGKVLKSILTVGSASNAECLSAPKVTKRVSFHKDVIIAQEEEEVASIIISSSTMKKRKGLFWHKLSLANLCEMKSRGEYIPLRE